MLHRKSLILIRLFRTLYWLVWMLRESSGGCCRTFLRRRVGFVIKGQTAQLSLLYPFRPLKMRPTPLLRNVAYQSFSDASPHPRKKTDCFITYCTIEARSYNHCCSGKALIVTYYKCMFEVLGIPHAMPKRRIVMCVLSDSTLFFFTLSS
jgi:hypothetical protein